MFAFHDKKSSNMLYTSHTNKLFNLGCVMFRSSGVMNAADYYGLEELRKACTGFVQCCINVDTVCALLASAERYIQYKCTKSLVQKVKINLKTN